jgi:hypothetical protein
MIHTDKVAAASCINIPTIFLNLYFKRLLTGISITDYREAFNKQMDRKKNSTEVILPYVIIINQSKHRSTSKHLSKFIARGIFN